jgi:O-antigen ligase
MQKAVHKEESDWPRYLTSGSMELLVMGVVALPLLFPGRFPSAVSLVSLGLLAAPFLLRHWRTGEFTRYTHANIPVLSLLFIFLPISLIVSPLPLTVSWPRFTTLAWSIGLFFVLANWPADVSRPSRGRTRLTLPTQLYLLLGMGAAGVGLLGMQAVDKLFYLPLPETFLALPFFGQGLATNEIAGVLTLFAPFAFTLTVGALATGRKKVAVVVGLMTVFLLAVMVLAQSRTALFSTAVALALALVLLLRPSWKWAVVALVSAGLLMIAAAQSGLLDRVIFAGANSWDSVIGPRLDVWGQAGFALRDFGLWGMGLGAFGPVVTRLYPLAPVAQAKVLEDAHNLYLQTMLDFGVIGGIIFAALLVYTVVVLVRQVRRRRARTMGRAWAVGLLAALVAHLFYSLTDAVAVGTLAGIPLWFLLGLVMARTHDAKPALKPAPTALAAALGLALLGGAVWWLYPSQQATRVVTAALMQGRNEAEALQLVSAAAESRCDLHWHEGLLWASAGQPAGRDASWTVLLDCTDRFANFMPILAPDNAPLAQEMIGRQPDSAVGYFWLAELAEADDPAHATALYRQGLALAPQDGRRWAYLAGLLVAAGDLDGALEAYLQSCRNGDPGANGCLGAGNVAARQGNLQDAIAYYRLSAYSGAWEAADALEQELTGQQP